MTWEPQTLRLGEVILGWTFTETATPPQVTLGPADAARAATATAPRRAQFLHGRALLHRLLDDLDHARPHPADAAPRLDAGRCQVCGKPHAGVAVADQTAIASLSYADSWVVAAVATTHHLSALGVDVEHDTGKPERLAELATLIGGPADGALRRWTQLEAVLKADGRGLRVDPAHVRIDADHAWVTDTSARYHLAEVAAPPGYLISLAYR